MPPVNIFDIDQIDPNKPLFGAERIEAINPHRGQMRLIDEVLWESEEKDAIVAVKHVKEDEFWVPGHIPGRPLFPGVLMIEAAAQASSFVVLQRETDQEFMGFVACDDVKFRGHVLPGDDLIIMAKQIDFRKRRQKCVSQAFVNKQMVFQASITGMSM